MILSHEWRRCGKLDLSHEYLTTWRKPMNSMESKKYKKAMEGWHSWSHEYSFCDCWHFSSKWAEVKLMFIYCALLSSAICYIVYLSVYVELVHKVKLWMWSLLTLEVTYIKTYGLNWNGLAGTHGNQPFRFFHCLESIWKKRKILLIFELINVF